MPVKFDHLWKIASKVGVVEGHDLSKFDELCQVGPSQSFSYEKFLQKARNATDPIVEPQPLWEYSSICTGKPTVIAHFDLAMKPAIGKEIFEKVITQKYGDIFFKLAFEL